MSRFVSELASPELVVRFQKLCGVEFVVEHEEGAGRLDQQQRSVADDQCRHGEATRLKWSTSEARLRGQSSSADNVGNTNNNNNNNDKSDGDSECGGSVADAAGSKNGYVQNHHHDRLPICSGVSTTNHPTTTQVLNGYSKNSSSNNSHHSSANNICDERPASKESCHPSPKHDLLNGSATKTNRSESKHEEINHSTRERVVAGKSATRVAIRYPILYYWAKVGAFLGNEEFYLTVMPYLLWAVDSALIRQAGAVWWLVMYLGQATKDYLGWARPPSPPVVRLETDYLAEYSMPSTHAMAGTAIPVVLSQLVLERYQLPVLPVLCIAALWFSTTCLSRLYLGVHTVLDVVCGIIYALAVYVGFSPLMSRYDYYQQTHPLAPLVLVTTSLALCTICYPSRNKSSAKADAVTTTAVIVGVGLGAWLNYQLGFTLDATKPVRVPVSAPTLWWLVMSLLQFVVGVAMVFVVKLAVKPVTVRFFSAFFGLDRVDAQHPSVMVGYKYITYMCLGLTMVFFAPLLFTRLGFGRPGYYLETV